MSSFQSDFLNHVIDCHTKNTLSWEVSFFIICIVFFHGIGQLQFFFLNRKSKLGHNGFFYQIEIDSGAQIHTGTMIQGEPSKHDVRLLNRVASACFTRCMPTFAMCKLISLQICVNLTPDVTLLIITYMGPLKSQNFNHDSKRARPWSTSVCCGISTVWVPSQANASRNPMPIRTC